MTRIRFNVGDRVRLAGSATCLALGMRPGLLGTVLERTSCPYVAWDGLTTGHDGNTDDPTRTDCWAVSQLDLERIDHE